jgi:hypothetical protein
VEKKVAKRVSKVRLAGGQEADLETIGVIFAAIGAIGGVFLFVAAANAPAVLGSSLVGFGLAAILNGIAAYVVFRAGAEIIRLLKKLCNLPFDGTISAPREEKHLRCSQCDTIAFFSEASCRTCQATFEDEPKPDL